MQRQVFLQLKPLTPASTWACHRPKGLAALEFNPKLTRRGSNMTFDELQVTNLMLVYRCQCDFPSGLKRMGSLCKRAWVSGKLCTRSSICLKDEMPLIQGVSSIRCPTLLRRSLAARLLRVPKRKAELGGSAPSINIRLMAVWLTSIQRLNGIGAKAGCPAQVNLILH